MKKQSVRLLLIISALSMLCWGVFDPPPCQAQATDRDGSSTGPAESTQPAPNPFQQFIDQRKQSSPTETDTDALKNFFRSLGVPRQPQLTDDEPSPGQTPEQPPAQPPPASAPPDPTAKKPSSETAPMDRPKTATVESRQPTTAPGKPESKSQTPTKIAVSDKPTRPALPQKGQIILNFDDADLYEVIRTFAELIGINYIADPNVRGKVTIHTARGLKKEDLVPVFYQILEANGLTAVQEGDLYKIIPQKNAPRTPIALATDSARIDISRGEKIVIQIIPLQYIAVQEMTKLLTPFVSAGGTIISHERANTLLVVDKSSNLDKILQLVDNFDIDFFDKIGHRFYVLNNIAADELVTVLKEIFASGTGERKDFVRFLPITHLNGILAVSPNQGIFTRVDSVIKQLDVVSESAEPRIYVYFVKNGTAEDLADLLTTVFQPGTADSKASRQKALEERKQKEAQRIRDQYQNPFSRNRAEAQQEARQRVSKEASQKGILPSEGSNTLRGEISVIADEVRNALIIEALPSDYRVVKGLLETVDILPRQVLIEAMIAEVRLDDRLELGLEWSYTKGVSTGTGLLDVGINRTTDGAQAKGLSVAVGFDDQVRADLTALADEGKVNILSSPHVLASENVEAKIDVSDEVPVASSETVITTGSQPLVTTNIQYRDTGVILSVTPHINERGLVTLDVSQEVSEQNEDDVEVAGTSYPAFFKRKVSTTLTVEDGQTIVIGGLISEVNVDDEFGVPGLKDVPILGWLFKNKTTTKRRSELIILLTPRVINDLEDVKRVTNEFKDRVGNVVKEIEF